MSPAGQILTDSRICPVFIYFSKFFLSSVQFFPSGKITSRHLLPAEHQQVYRFVTDSQKFLRICHSLKLSLCLFYDFEVRSSEGKEVTISSVIEKSTTEWCVGGSNYTFLDVAIETTEIMQAASKWIYKTLGFVIKSIWRENSSGYSWKPYYPFYFHTVHKMDGMKYWLDIIKNRCSLKHQAILELLGISLTVI